MVAVAGVGRRVRPVQANSCQHHQCGHHDAALHHRLTGGLHSFHPCLYSAYLGALSLSAEQCSCLTCFPATFALANMHRHSGASSASPHCGDSGLCRVYLKLSCSAAEHFMSYVLYPDGSGIWCASALGLFMRRPHNCSSECI